MKTISLLVFVVSLNAQITTTLHKLPNSVEEVRVRNDSSVNLIAFAVYSKDMIQGFSRQGSRTDSAPFVVYSDPLVDPSLKPVLPREERELLRQGRVFGPRSAGSQSAPIPLASAEFITAGIFADGSTAGDPALLTRLIARRCSMLQAVETTLDTLLEAGRRNIPREQLIAHFKKMAESLRRWYLPAEQQVGTHVYQPMVGKLVNLPEGELGAPFPPTRFIEQETAALNRQRVALLESQPNLAQAAFLNQ